MNAATSWEIWQYTAPDRARIEHVFRYASDEQACKQRYAELESSRTPGTYELRRDGVYLAMYSLTPPDDYDWVENSSPGRPNAGGPGRTGKR